jgi:hypothetical protein
MVDLFVFCILLQLVFLVILKLFLSLFFIHSIYTYACFRFNFFCYFCFCYFSSDLFLVDDGNGNITSVPSLYSTVTTLPNVVGNRYNVCILLLLFVFPIVTSVTYCSLIVIY